MKTRIFLILNLIALLVLAGCEDKAEPPLILFENEVDSISGVFPGDLFFVKGEIIAEEPLAGAFYFHQKRDTTGTLTETGDRLELGLDGPPNSFSLGFNVEATTVGVKIIAEDVEGNRTVKIFRVIQGIDDITISFDGPDFIESIESGESFNVKGVVNSETNLTGLNYRIVLGEIMEVPVPIDVTDDHESPFDVSLQAKNGMTGVLFTATNKGGLTAEELFRIDHVATIGAVILLDKELVEVKPDSAFTVSGTITSDLELTSLTYNIVRGDVTGPEQLFTMTGERFSFEVNAGEDVTGVIVNAIDADNNETLAILPVSILFPEKVEGDVMVHYKNIILTDEQFPKAYFSFSMAPYVLNGTQAAANQNQVDLIFANCFISEGSNFNGPAIFGPNVSKASTIQAHAWVEGWSTPYNLSRLPRALDFTSTLGMTFDEIGDSSEDWDAIDAYIKDKIANSSVVRGYNFSVGYMFAIGFGGTTVGEIDQYAVAIIRGFGGEAASEPNESTGAWVELEIKIRK